MLEGLHILEFEGLGPGPFCAMLLADLGAEVTVIHRPQAASIPGMTGESLLDRGKKSIVLDLKSPEDHATALALVAQADALIEGNRPGVMERLRLGPSDCHALNPKLVYGRMTGWGQTGPLAQSAGHDMNYVSRSGALWYSSPAGMPPFGPPTLVGDIGGGAMYLAVGILAGVMRARTYGQGTVVDAAIVDGSAHMMALLMSMRQQGGFTSTRGQSILDGPHWSRSYVTQDGKYIVVQPLEPKFYTLMLQGFGLQDDPDFRDQQFNPQFWAPLGERLAQIIKTRPQAHWLAIFEGQDACVSPLHAPEEAAADPHLLARGTWTQSPLQPNPAPRFDGMLRSPGPVPSRGQHSDEIRARLSNWARKPALS